MRGWLLLGVLLLGVASWSAAGGAETRRFHSGTLVDIDPLRGTMVLEEVGPWRVVGGETVTTRLAITLRPATRFVFVSRDPGALFPGAFVPSPLSAGELVPGDFITVDCRHEGARLIAITVTAAELDE